MFSPDEILKRTFLYETDSGEVLRSEVIRRIDDQASKRHENIKFLCKIGDDYAEEILTYVDLCHLCEEQDRYDVTNKVHTYKKVLGHKGPLKQGDPEYNGSMYSVLILWETNEETWEPLSSMRAQDPVTLATYALENKLLDTPGWKSLKRYTKNAKKLKCLVNQATMKSER